MLTELPTLFDNYINEVVFDNTATNWPLMKSASFILMIITIYILIVISIGPRFMENRRAYDLKKIMIFYNIFQVVACSILFVWILRTGISIGCVPLSVMKTSEISEAARITWWTMLLKLAELIETIFFVMRKKQNQVSILHVYHHASTLSIVWAAVKIFPSSMILVPIMLNCAVHMLMYIYYLLSAIGPEIQESIDKWKKYITIMQMVQFGAVVIHASQIIIIPRCGVPYIYPYIFIPNVFLVFYMFFKFYINSYSTKTIHNN